MDPQLVILCLLTGVINFIGALAYGARIAGVRTRRVAMSFALFNILILVSRLSNGFLGPLVASRVEGALAAGGGEGLLHDFRWLLASASAAVALGIALVPTAQRLFARVIERSDRKNPLIRTALRSVTPGGLRVLRASLTLPRAPHREILRRVQVVGWPILLANCLAQALLAVGVFASIYAGYLNPEFRVTASQLSAVINGFATILLFAVIDPHLSVLTDEAVEGTLGEGDYRHAVILISLSRLAGTILAQALFVPAAWAVAWVADLL